MKKIILLLCLFIHALVSLAQNILYDPVSGRVFSSERYSGVNGSPFLYDKWIAGTASTSKGTYVNLELKLDAYNNTLMFRRGEDPYEFQDKVTGFTLMPNKGDSSSYMYFKNGISGSGVKPDQYLQILAEGNVSLYRSDLKLMTDVNQINQGVIKSFTSSSRYFIMKNNELIPVRMTKKEIFEVLKDKEKELDSFATQNSLNTKKDADLIKIVRYYNSISQPRTPIP